MRVTPSSRLHALPFVNVQRVETCIGHAHKRLKRDPETIYIKATVATRQPQTDGSSDAGGETHTAAGAHSNGHKVVINGSDRNGKVLQGQAAIFEDSKQWLETAFPSYLQSQKDDFCQSWEEAMQDVERKQSAQSGHQKKNAVTSSNPVWQAIRKEAARDAANEPLLSSFMYASILSHDNFMECLAFVLANRMSNPTTLATEYFDAFMSTFSENDELVQAALDDLQAVRERDPACGSYSNAILFYKGYQAIQVHRIANKLWTSGQKISARALQSRVSEVFSMDIHPQAKMGKGILMDHGTGIVIGQTAEIGNNVSILQNVTLGGTGKEDGDRHPKISDNVLIGAAATILGNIRIGKGAMVAAGSLVLKAVPRNTMVAGSPAKEIGCMTGNPALKMQHWLKGISATSDPFSENFERMLRTNSGKKNGHRHVSDIAQERETDANDSEPSRLCSGPETAGAKALLGSPTHSEATQQGDQSVPYSANGVSQENGLTDVNLTQSLNPKGQPQATQGHEGEYVESVMSDSKASKLWPNPQEPEYYL